MNSIKMKKMLVFLALISSFLTYKSEAKLVGRWKFDEDSGNKAKDSSGYGYDAVLFGATWDPNGKVGGAMSFDGKGYLSFPAGIFFTVDKAISISFWQYGYTDTKNTLFEGQNSKGETILGASIPFTTKSQKYVMWFSFSSIERLQKELESQIFKNQWNHWVFTKDTEQIEGNKGIIKIYLNGSLLGKSSGNSTEIRDITSFKFGTGYVGGYRGLVDDIAIFDHAVDLDEITLLYYEGGGVELSPEIQELAKQSLQKPEDIIVTTKGKKEAATYIEKELLECKEIQKMAVDTSTTLVLRTIEPRLNLLLAKILESDQHCEKAKVVEAYRNVLKTCIYDSSIYSSALLGLINIASADDIVTAIKSNYFAVQNNSTMLAFHTQRMIDANQASAAKELLEKFISAYDIALGHKSTDPSYISTVNADIFFQLARARCALKEPPSTIAQAYLGAFSPVSHKFVTEQTAALIWLLENNFTEEYGKAITLFGTTKEISQASGDLVHNICKYYESKHDWVPLEQFLNTLFSKVKYPVQWGVFLDSYFSSESEWKKEYLNYINNKGEFAFNVNCALAEKYFTQNNFDKAGELYRAVLSTSGNRGNIEPYRFNFCKSLFMSKRFKEVIPELETFISNNRGIYAEQVAEAMLMKARSHINLGEINKALDQFLTFIVVYPDAKQSDETKFLMGYCYMLSNKFNEAKSSFDLLIKDNPQSSYADKAKLYLERIKSMTE